MTLCELFARPKEIRVAGVPYLALPLRVRDLADLEYIARLVQPDPLLDLTDGSPELVEVRKSYRYAMETAERSECGWGSEECNRIVFGTVGGRSAYLCAVLRSHRECTSQWAADAVLKITAEEWQAIDRAAFGSDPIAELVRRADAMLGIEPWPGKAVSWVEAVTDVCRLLGKTAAEVGDMTIPELRAHRSGGKSDPWKCGGTDEEEAAWASTVSEKRWAFWSEPLPETIEESSQTDETENPGQA